MSIISFCAWSMDLMISSRSDEWRGRPASDSKVTTWCGIDEELPGVRVVEVRLRDKPQRDDKQGGEERKTLDHGLLGSDPLISELPTIRL